MKRSSTTLQARGGRGSAPRLRDGRLGPLAVGALCALLLAAAAPHGTTIYVDSLALKNGTGVATDPFNLFTSALDHASAGYTIQLAGGAYPISGKLTIARDKLPLTLSFGAGALRSLVRQPDGTHEAEMVENTTALLGTKSPFNCAAEGKDPRGCPVIITKDPLHPGSTYRPIKLEPSGLVWSPELEMLVGVSDNYNDLIKPGINPMAPGYVVFAFDPYLTNDAKNFVAQPVFTRSLAAEIFPYDLEGITRVCSFDGCLYYATGSLSLHATNEARDTWFRFQLIRFTIDQETKLARDVEWVSAQGRRDLREWFLSQDGIPWEISAAQERPETGEGMNVEGIGTVGHIGEKGNDLLFGFRGPMFHKKALMARVSPPAKPTQPPKLIKVGFLEDPEATDYGVRGFAPSTSSGTHQYVIMGPTDTQHEPLTLICGDIDRWSHKKTFAKGFVAEGVAVVKDTTLAVVDDLNARYSRINVHCP